MGGRGSFSPSNTSLTQFPRRIGLVRDADYIETEDAGAYAGSHAPLEDADEAPEGFPIKGNKDSMKYHEPDGQWFEQTVAEVWFDSAASVY